MNGLRGRLLTSGLVLSLLAAAPAHAGLCFLGCDVSLTGQEAVEASALILPDLPEAAIPSHLLEGGFQDQFIQIRIEIGAAALEDTLAAFGLTHGDFAPLAGQQITLTETEWWLAEAETALVVETTLPGFAVTRLALLPDPSGNGDFLLFVLAFQT